MTYAAALVLLRDNLFRIFPLLPVTNDVMAPVRSGAA